MSVTCVSVRRKGDGWGVTETGLNWFLAEFTTWEDALDYARRVALAREESMIEGEDPSGQLTLRQLFSTDAGGVVRIRSMAC